MRRRAELVSLRIEDIEYKTPGHARILLRKSKTDQEGTGQWVHLGKEATAAIKRWLKTSRLNSGYIFRGISPAGVPLEGLSSGQVGRIFKAVSKDAGLAEEITRSISGHSLRVGGAQDLLLGGASLTQIMVKGGWVKTDTVIRYVERVGDPIRLVV
jgi:integrase